jgi:hypothetical protein
MIRQINTLYGFSNEVSIIENHKYEINFLSIFSSKFSTNSKFIFYRRDERWFMTQKVQ